MLPTKPAHNHSSELSVCRMTKAERLVAMSFRLWALPYAHAEQSHPDWMIGFRTLGLEHIGLELFHPLMETIFESTQRIVEIHHLKCCSVTDDEAFFLRCISLYQHQKIDEAKLILAAWLPQGSARIAASLASRLAAALDAAQLSLPLHQAPERNYRIMEKLVANGAGPGLGLIH